MRSIVAWMILGIAIAALTACSNIRLTEDGKNVIEMKKLDVLEKCENLGNIKVNATNVNRTQEDKDRAILARNMAATMGANVVVPAGEVVGKSQEWTAYRCP
jgi:hypothetical protein